MDIVLWMDIIDALMGKALSLEELSDTCASILPRERKCNRVFP